MHPKSKLTPRLDSLCSGLGLAFKGRNSPSRPWRGAALSLQALQVLQAWPWPLGPEQDPQQSSLALLFLTCLWLPGLESHPESRVVRRKALGLLVGRGC